MGVSLVKIILECVVPRQGLIAIKRIAATDADSGEIGIRLDEFADFQEIGFCAFVPCLIIRAIADLADGTVADSIDEMAAEISSNAVTVFLKSL